MFSAALQQAYEFAEAASRSGYATKALPLFYALGQGIRAFAAAFLDGDRWELTNHGASFEVSEEPTILDTRVKPWSPGTSGTLQAIARLEGVDPWTASTTLGELWRASARQNLRKQLYDAPGPVHLELPFQSGFRESDIAFGLLTFAARGISARTTPAAAIARLMAAYPVFANATPASDLLERGYANRLARQGEHAVYIGKTYSGLHLGAGYAWADDAPVLQVPLQDATDEGYEGLVDSLRLRTHPVVYPRLAGVDRPSWLMVDWARAFSLSNLVRYRPAEWAAAVDLDTSELAVPLQRLCDDLEAWVPTMLLAIGQQTAVVPAPD